MKKWRQIIKILLWITVGIFVLDALIILFFSIYQPSLKKADAIVVLGAAINTPESYNRSLHGLKLYNDGDAPVIVLSGGQDFPHAEPEANYMEQVIEANSKNPVPLILEDQSHSTYDNIVNTKQQLGGAKSLIIVSDTYHLARAVLIAKREGFSPVYWSSPSESYYTTKDLLYYYVREVFAIINYIPKFIHG